MINELSTKVYEAEGNLNTAVLEADEYPPYSGLAQDGYPAQLRSNLYGAHRGSSVRTRSSTRKNEKRLVRNDSLFFVFQRSRRKRQQLCNYFLARCEGYPSFAKLNLADMYPHQIRPQLLSVQFTRSRRPNGITLVPYVNRNKNSQTNE